MVSTSTISPKRYRIAGPPKEWLDKTILEECPFVGGPSLSKWKNDVAARFVAMFPPDGEACEGTLQGGGYRKLTIRRVKDYIKNKTSKSYPRHSRRSQMSKANIHDRKGKRARCFRDDIYKLDPQVRAHNNSLRLRFMAHEISRSTWAKKQGAFIRKRMTDTDVQEMRAKWERGQITVDGSYSVESSPAETVVDTVAIDPTVTASFPPADSAIHVLLHQHRLLAAPDVVAPTTQVNTTGDLSWVDELLQTSQFFGPMSSPSSSYGNDAGSVTAYGDHTSGIPPISPSTFQSSAITTSNVLATTTMDTEDMSCFDDIGQIFNDELFLPDELLELAASISSVPPVANHHYAPIPVYRDAYDTLRSGGEQSYYSEVHWA